MSTVIFKDKSELTFDRSSVDGEQWLINREYGAKFRVEEDESEFERLAREFPESIAIREAE